MVAAISLLSVVAGATTASLAGRFPTYVDKIETGAGLLIIGGCALLGCSLPTLT